MRIRKKLRPIGARTVGRNDDHAGQGNLSANPF